METKPFFGESGLTSTSANHFANLAKEVNRQNENYLANVQFFTTAMSIIGSNESGITHEGNKTEELPVIERTIANIAALYSLSAFFREAIAEKERLMKEAENWVDARVREEFDAKVAELKSRKPVRANYITEEDVVRSWSIGELERYYSLETEAAWLGKFVHENGMISQARIALMQVMSKPKTVKENGRDTIIYTYTPTADALQVDEMFFRLQKKQREVQAELNGMKKRIEDAIRENKIKVDEEYGIALSKWNMEKHLLDDEYQEFLEDESRSRTNRIKAVEDLKIVVPNRLKEVYESLK